MALKEQLFPFESASEKQTRSLGERFGKWLTPGSVVALIGDLGAGKTQFVKGIAAHFGIDERDVSSPTFTIANEYSAIEGKAATDSQTHLPSDRGNRREDVRSSPPENRPIKLVHMDLYRLKSDAELFESGIEEYLHSDSICVIEWPERAGHLLPSHTHIVNMRHHEGGKRLIEYRGGSTGHGAL